VRIGWVGQFLIVASSARMVSAALQHWRLLAPSSRRRRSGGPALRD
jgi:hypothetical protein